MRIPGILQKDGISTVDEVAETFFRILCLFWIIRKLPIAVVDSIELVEALQHGDPATLFSVTITDRNGCGASLVRKSRDKLAVIKTNLGYEVGMKSIACGLIFTACQQIWHNLIDDRYLQFVDACELLIDVSSTHPGKQSLWVAMTALSHQVFVHNDFQPILHWAKEISPSSIPLESFLFHWYMHHESLNIMKNHSSGTQWVNLNAFYLVVSRHSESCLRRSHLKVTSCIDLKDGRWNMGIAEPWCHEDLHTSFPKERCPMNPMNMKCTGHVWKPS